MEGRQSLKKGKDFERVRKIDVPGSSTPASGGRNSTSKEEKHLKKEQENLTTTKLAAVIEDLALGRKIALDRCSAKRYTPSKGNLG